MSFSKKTILSLVLTVLAGASLSSNSIPWKQRSSFQFAQDIKLPELIRSYGALQGLSVFIDAAVPESQVNGRFEDLSPEEFMDRVSRAHNLSWVYVEKGIYVYPAQKTTTTFLNISELAAKKLLMAISNLGIVSPGSSVRIMENGGLAFVSGPPKYQEIVNDLAQRLSQNLQINFSESPKVRIFPLKYAWAYDTSFNTQESSVTLPGVATVLRGLMDTGTNVSPSVITGPEKTNRIPVAKKIKTFKQENHLVEDHNKEIPEENQEASQEEEQFVRSNSATVIQPDVRLNAVIIRDVEEKMPQYEEIINTLDVPVQLIEIGVAIVDVNASYSRNLGNKFFSIQNLDDANQNAVVAPGGFGSDGSPGSLTGLTSGFNLSGSAVVDGWRIISQVQALESEGNANILSRPSILTLNNMEAEVSQSESYYVSLQGKDSSDLAQVTASTSVRVTPRVIVDRTGKRKIKLLIKIDDGTIDTATVVDLPRTSNSSLYTQAVINEGQSLLVGGIYKQRNEKTDSGLPFLRCIPLLGYLFKSNDKTNSSQERMFLITPRVINLAYEESPDLDQYFKCDPTLGIADDIRSNIYDGNTGHRNNHTAQSHYVSTPASQQRNMAHNGKALRKYRRGRS